MKLEISNTHWWELEQYTDASPIPEGIQRLAGPHGLALVKVLDDQGRTTSGWGTKPDKDGKTFIDYYKEGRFKDRRALRAYDNLDQPFAIVCRSARIIVIDIDGKNGGLEHVGRMGSYPYTLAEKSKSGNGYHLFYELDQEWDSALGYGSVFDRNGIVQGVDIRAVGCVYHHPQQRWNTRKIAKAPTWLLDMLAERQARRTASQEAAQRITNMDPLEKIMAQSEILDELAQPIGAGKRNSTLFAIGSKLKVAEVPDWEQAIYDRGNEIGLDVQELDKIIDNINTYA